MVRRHLKHFSFSGFKLLLVVLMLGAFSSHAQKKKKGDAQLGGVSVKSNCKIIIGYYPSWQQYKRNGLMSPDNVDYSKYTILNYSFFAPLPNGEIVGTDAWGDSILLRGRFDFGNPVQPAYVPNTSVIDIAHAWGVKVMVSIGGWTLSDNFPKLAADPELRAKFASSCVKALRMYNFDGIDIDWEYPGYKDHGGTPDDKQNYTLFMRSIRDSIDAYGSKIGYKFLLTACYGANLSTMEDIEWDKISPFMDYMNLMTYDFNGVWSEDANHNSPLYTPAKGYEGSYDLAYKLMTQKFNVPAEKLNMGVAFYGRSLIGKPGTKIDLHSKEHIGKSDTITFFPDYGGESYYNVLLHMKEFTRHWDKTAQVPYLVGINKNTFLSYDDEEAIRLKAQYVNDHNCAGVIIWDITNDYCEKKKDSGFIGSTPLIDVLNEVLTPCPHKYIRKRYDF